MMPETRASILVRDGTEDDIAACLALDSRYETDAVMQVYLNGTSAHGWDIGLQRQRLPRPVELSQPVNRTLIRSALDAHHCFLVAQSRDDEASLHGCLVLIADDAHAFGRIQALVVQSKSRRQKVAMRLLAACGTWAKEHHLNRLQAEVHTKNAPAIRFLESAGFSFCGFNDRYFSDESIALFFSLSLK
jgi:GNAT superfamily N-acetyltransferase